MRKIVQLITLIIALLVMHPAAYADITITVKNIDKDKILLTYNDYKGTLKRHDRTLENGKVTIQIKDTINDFTKFTLIIKEFTVKTSLGGYYYPTVAYFYGSQKTNLQINVEGRPNNTLTYDIVDDLKNSINKDLISFNREYEAVTADYMKASIEMQQMRDQVTPKNLEGKEAISAANVELRKNPEYTALMNKRSKLNDGSKLRFDYVKANINLLSSSLLYDLYSSQAIKEDSLVKVLVKRYPKEIQNQLYCQATYKRLTMRSGVIEGVKITNLTGVTVDGKPFSSADYRGKKYLLIDFWGTWCGPCVKGMPDMKLFYDKYKDQIEFVSICCNDTENKWRTFLTNHSEYNWIHLFDAEKKFVSQFAIDGFPTKIILDKSGKIVYRRLGERQGDYEDIEKIIK